VQYAYLAPHTKDGAGADSGVIACRAMKSLTALVTEGRAASFFLSALRPQAF
jgi:hypothetical protein